MEQTLSLNSVSHLMVLLDNVSVFRVTFPSLGCLWLLLWIVDFAHTAVSLCGLSQERASGTCMCGMTHTSFTAKNVARYPFQGAC